MEKETNYRKKKLLIRMEFLLKQAKQNQKPIFKILISQEIKAKLIINEKVKF